MKQIWPNYSYSPATNVLTLTGLNIDRDQLLLVAAPERGRIMYNFADSSVTASAFTAGANTSLTLVASTAGLTTTAALVIYYDDQLTNTSISISNFPATQTISGTVTANVVGKSNTNDGTLYPIPVCESGNTDYLGRHIPIGFKNFDAESTLVDNDNPLPIAGTVTANVMGFDTANGVFVKLPIGQPVNAFGNTEDAVKALIGNENGSINSFNPMHISGTVTAQLNYVPGSAIGYDGGGNDQAGIRLGFNTDTEFSIVTNNNGLPIQGTVTISALPKITLIDGSGSVVTANSAIQVFSTSSTRSYLLVQVTTGSAYVNVGATATTANGIYLSSGQGYAWETTIPQGIVSLISSVTGTAYCAKQA